MNTNGVNYDYSVSVFITAMGTPSPIEPSAAGHMWFGLEDYTNVENLEGKTFGGYNAATNYCVNFMFTALRAAGGGVERG